MGWAGSAEGEPEIDQPRVSAAPPSYGTAARRKGRLSRGGGRRDCRAGTGDGRRCRQGVGGLPHRRSRGRSARQVDEADRAEASEGKPAPAARGCPTDGHGAVRPDAQGGRPRAGVGDDADPGSRDSKTAAQQSSRAAEQQDQHSRAAGQRDTPPLRRSRGRTAGRFRRVRRYPAALLFRPLLRSPFVARPAQVTPQGTAPSGGEQAWSPRRGGRTTIGSSQEPVLRQIEGSERDAMS